MAWVGVEGVEGVHQRHLGEEVAAVVPQRTRLQVAVEAAVVVVVVVHHPMAAELNSSANDKAVYKTDHSCKQSEGACVRGGGDDMPPAIARQHDVH